MEGECCLLNAADSDSWVNESKPRNQVKLGKRIHTYNPSNLWLLVGFLLEKKIYFNILAAATIRAYICTEGLW